MTTSSFAKGLKAADQGSRISALLVLVLAATLLVPALSCRAAEKTILSNGLNVTLYGADEIRNLVETDKDGELELIHPSIGTLALAPLADRWFPLDRDVVLEALEQMQGFTTRLDVDVFVLPSPPSGIESSFARRGAIFLAPGTGVVPDATTAYITTHEMGHVLTWAFLDDRQARWDAYIDRRGLTAANLDPAAVHADRAREILAEDIRYLFGGALATLTGSVENHDIVLPDQVDGLQELLAGYFAAGDAAPLPTVSRAYPNPCNPLTNIQMSLPDGSTSDGTGAVLRVFDIRGALVRTVRGGYAANGAVTVQWDGTADSGGGVASGRYFYVMQDVGAVGRGSVTLVR